LLNKPIEILLLISHEATRILHIVIRYIAQLHCRLAADVP